MLRLSRRIWRHWVLLFARHMPVESAAICMALSVLALLNALFLLPSVADYASASPGIAEALQNSYGRSCLRGLMHGLIFGAFAVAWLFQARCLQICYPGFYDPYAPE